jgi:threonine dehydrogenase-like Zn-dependent dehydrogenase
MIKVDADYLVVGEGAIGLAFTDAPVDHSAARVVIVDRDGGGVGGRRRREA